MTATSNSETITSSMRALPSRIRSEANISDRPGQLGRLELIATEVEALLEAATRAESPASQPIPAPVDSGTIGRLNEAQREIVGDMAGCGCCSSRSSIDKVMPDACPNEDGWINHSYSEADGCNQMIPIEDLVERIVREHTDRTLAEVEQRIEARFDRIPAPAEATRASFATVLDIVRAARQEQGR